MEKNTFTITESRREKVTKLVAQYQKKADKYGIPMKVTFGEPYIKKVQAYDDNPAFRTRRNVGFVYIEVFDLTIESEIIRKDGYSIVSKIEHMTGGNVITTYGDTETDPEWTTAPAWCDHCNTNRMRDVTFIVRHDNGTQKQVGSTCLKDYCGIDPQKIGILNKLSDVVRNTYNVDDDYDIHGHVGDIGYDIIEMLALSIMIFKRYGYVKSGEYKSNKDRLIDYSERYVHAGAEMEEARRMAEEIADMDEETAVDALLNNVQALIRSEYCKVNHFGYIAYAPVAYRKYIERMERKAKYIEERRAEAKISQWVGDIGGRIEVDVNIRLLTSWDTQYGTTYLYKMVDENGNVYIWFASRELGVWNRGNWERCTEGRIKGFIKDHTERDGVKQTVLWRCKLVECKKVA